MELFAHSYEFEIKKLIQEVVCPHCGGADENMNHLFRFCLVSEEVWSSLNLSLALNNPCLDFYKWLTVSFKATTNQQR